MPEECFKGITDPEQLPQQSAPKLAAETHVIKHLLRRPALSSLISVHDFEAVARDNFTAKTYAFYSSAATDLVTQQANIQVWRQLLLRPRILRNVSKVSIKRRILGIDCDAPFFVSPAAMARLAHPDGELALARGCGKENIIQTVSGPVP